MAIQTAISANRIYSDTDTVDLILSNTTANYLNPRSPNLLERTLDFYRWQNARRENGLWPYARSLDGKPGAMAHIQSDAGASQSGINFASQDYLSLASHPRVEDAAMDALYRFGPHSAGSPDLLGNTAPSLQLERELAEVLNMAEIVLFPTGWAAGFGGIAGLVRHYDHIVLDKLAHACLQQGAYAATKNVHRNRHLDVGHIRSILSKIRSADAKNGILVVTEGIFSMDADYPNVEAIQAACHEYNATLLIDIAHDFGALGPGGTGIIGMQDMLGKVDVVMGSFSKTFASNGGFVAVQTPAAKQYLKYYAGTHMFSNGLSPVQAAIVSAALEVVCSSEGQKRREQLLRVIRIVRGELRHAGIHCLGGDSPIIPVLIGDYGFALEASKCVAERGLLVNLVEYPAVPITASRFRMQAMAGHSEDQARQAAHIISEVFKELAQRSVGQKSQTLP